MLSIVGGEFPTVTEALFVPSPPCSSRAVARQVKVSPMAVFSTTERDSISVDAKDSPFLSHTKPIIGVPPSVSEAVAEHVSVLSGVILFAGSIEMVSIVGFVLTMIAEAISLTAVVPSSKVIMQLIISSGSTTPIWRSMVFVLPIIFPL